MDENAGIASTAPPEPEGILNERIKRKDNKRFLAQDVYVFLNREVRRKVDKLVRRGTPLAMALVKIGISPFVDLTKKKDENKTKVPEGETPQFAQATVAQSSLEAKLP